MLKNGFNYFRGVRNIKLYTAIVLFVFLLTSTSVFSATYNDSEYAKIVKQDTGFEPNIIEIRGNRTSLSVTQLQDFFDQTSNVTLKYQHPNDGSVIGYGYHFASGYFTVDFLEGSEVNNNTIEDIYMTLETEAQKMGIQDVGVVFQYSDFLFLEEEELLPEDEIQTEEANVESSTDESENEMLTEETDVEISTDEPQNETETTNTTPGFSALTLLIMIFVVWRFKPN